MEVSSHFVFLSISYLFYIWIKHLFNSYWCVGNRDDKRQIMHVDYVKERKKKPHIFLGVKYLLYVKGENQKIKNCKLRFRVMTLLVHCQLNSKAPLLKRQRLQTCFSKNPVVENQIVQMHHTNNVKDKGWWGGESVVHRQEDGHYSDNDSAELLWALFSSQSTWRLKCIINIERYVQICCKFRWLTDPSYHVALQLHV